MPMSGRPGMGSDAAVALASSTCKAPRVAGSGGREELGCSGDVAARPLAVGGEWDV
jgi:hypothetical protein